MAYSYPLCPTHIMRSPETSGNQYGLPYVGMTNSRNIFAHEGQNGKGS